MQYETQTLYEYWRVIYKRKWMVTATFAVTLLVASIYALMRPPEYRAEAIVRIAPPSFYTRLPGYEATNWYPSELLSNEVRVVESSDVARRAALRLGWIKTGMTPEQELEETGKISALYAAETMDGGMLKIFARGREPKVLAEVVNAVVLAYRDHDMTERTSQASKTLEDLEKRKTELAASLDSSEKLRQAFMAKNPSLGLSDSLAMQLMDLESRYKELLKVYTEEHYEVKQMRQRIAAAKSSLAQMPAKDAELVRLTREMRLNEDLYTTVNRQYEEARVMLSSVSSFVSPLSPAVPPTEPIAPNRRVSVLMGAFLGLFLGVVAAFILESLDVSISNIEELETLLETPVIGIIPSIASENKNRLAAWLPRFIKMRRNKIENFRNQLVLESANSGPLMEPYHSLRASILSKLGADRPLTLLFSSSGESEGKTLTTINFAASAAHAGLKVLLVDIDFRKGMVNKALGIPDAPGFSDIFTKKVPWENAVARSTDLLMGKLDKDRLIAFAGLDNLSVIPRGHALPNTVDFLQSIPVEQMLKEWKTRFDLIIFDTPPILMFVDAVLMSKNMDGVVLVYRSGYIPREAVRRAKNQLADGGAHILGVALNDINQSDLGPQSVYKSYGNYNYELPRP